MQIPQDIKPDWFNVIRRLQSIARKQQGYAIIKVNIVVNQDGVPIVWSSPRMIKIEPKDSDTILELLSD